MLKTILAKQLEAIKENEVAVMLSGGVDSTSLALLLKEQGKTVIGYSFTFCDHESTDFKRAKEFCERFSVEFMPIYLPTEIKTLKHDLFVLIKELGLRGKAEIECTWPFLYAFSQVKEEVIVTGHGADGHFGISKKAMIHYKNRLDEFRSELFSKPNYAQQQTLKELAGLMEKDIYLPYLSQEVKRHFSGTTWEEINKPKQKQPILDLFPDEFKALKAKPHTNLQLGDSRISEHFQRLLKTDWNTKNYKSPTGIYNSIARGEFTPDSC